MVFVQVSGLCSQAILILWCRVTIFFGAPIPFVHRVVPVRVRSLNKVIACNALLTCLE